jgi:hypothetical protein
MSRIAALLTAGVVLVACKHDDRGAQSPNDPMDPSSPAASPEVAPDPNQPSEPDESNVESNPGSSLGPIATSDIEGGGAGGMGGRAGMGGRSGIGGAGAIWGGGGSPMAH